MLKNVMKMSRGQIYKFNLGDPPPIIKDRAICQTNSDIYILYKQKWRVDWLFGRCVATMWHKATPSKGRWKTNRIWYWMQVMLSYKRISFNELGKWGRGIWCMMYTLDWMPKVVLRVVREGGQFWWITYACKIESDLCYTNMKPRPHTYGCILCISTSIWYHN